MRLITKTQINKSLQKKRIIRKQERIQENFKLYQILFTILKFQGPSLGRLN